MTRVKLEYVISPAAANGPIGMIFGMGMDIDQCMPIFGKSKSKVKGQGQNNTTNRFLQRFLVTSARFLVHSRPKRVK